MNLKLSNMVRCFRGKRETSVNVVLLGLDYAGKTTLLYRMLYGESVHTIPTIGSQKKTYVDEASDRFSFYDIGGLPGLRVAWRPYVRIAQRLLYVIDATDTERLPLAVAQLTQMLRDNGGGSIIDREKRELSVLVCLNFKSRSLHLGVLRRAQHALQPLAERVQARGQVFQITPISAHCQVDAQKIFRWVQHKTID